MQSKIDFNQFNADIIHTARLAGATYNEAAVRPVLDTYHDFITRGGTGLRVTTKDHELAVRYMLTGEGHDPVPAALAAGLIPDEGHPIEQITDELSARYPLFGNGVDLTVSRGFAKSWPILQTPQSPEAIASLPSMPASVKNYLGHFERFGLKHVGLLALDFQNKTVNLYFMLRIPSILTAEKIAALLQDVDLPVPDRDELEVSALNAGIYYTFNWESPRVERVCVGLLGVFPPVRSFMYPHFKQFVDEAPTLLGQRGFVFCTTYGVRGNYLKVEIDYSGIGESLKTLIDAVPEAEVI